MGIGFGLLRLSPRTLWSMTPREFAHAAGWIGRRAVAPDRADLEAMMARFPDSKSFA